MHSFAAPARQPAVHRLAANGLVKTGVGMACHPALAVCVIAFALVAAGVTTAHAQDTGGTIMIAGPAETNQFPFGTKGGISPAFYFPNLSLAFR